jgi:hypothetical protein
MPICLAPGESEAAGIVRKHLERTRTGLHKSAALGMESVIHEQLPDVWDECSQRGWDGYGANPISEDTYLLAKRFLRSLPLGVPTPSIGAEPDGCITVEWRPARRRTLSVSVSPDGDLYYAALLGPEKVSGAAPFYDEAPRAISDLIRRVYSC